MTFAERYRKGETEDVYSDIESLGDIAFSEKYSLDIQEVLIDTMQRVSYNLLIFYIELQNRNYNFNRKIKYNFQNPISKPLENTSLLIYKLEKAAAPFGSVPLSLKMFYKIVGACNFAWDYKTDENILWECADAIQIYPLDDLLEEVTNEYWVEQMLLGKEIYDTAYLDLSADYLHKDNISGGPPYSIEITSKKSIDANFLNEEHQTSFINYLRIIFKNCGFGRIEDLKSRNDFKEFYDKVKPQLREI